MITFEEAKQIALDRIGPDCALLEDKVIEKPYGWYFRFQTKAYLESGNPKESLIGSGGFVVEKEEGHVFEFSSANPLEHNLAAYEAGFRYDFYDFTVTSVSDIEQTVQLLLKLGMTHTIPEEDHGIVWRIPKSYTEAQIRSYLNALPHTFSNQHFFSEFTIFQEIDSVGCCEYHLKGHRGNNQ